MTNEEKILTVARYLEGDMELQEKQTFEVLLNEDPELQALVIDYNDVHQTLKMRIAPSEADKKVGETLTNLNKVYFKTEQSEYREGDSARVVSLRPYLKWMSIAAVLIIGLFVWAPWSANLYEKYAISKEMSVVERSNDKKTEIEEAADFYNAHDFASAKRILEKQYMLNPKNSMVSYYYGVTLIETGKADHARTVLEELYNGESVFKYDAAYYVALIYVKQQQNDSAIEWLAKIPAGTANYEHAQELTKKLK